jgi:allantoinase
MTPAQWLDYAKACFDPLYREGEAGNPDMMSLRLHLRIIGRPGRIWAFEEFLRHVKARKAIWIATRHEIAQHLPKVDPA